MKRGQGLEFCHHKPRNAKDCQNHQKLEEVRKAPFLYRCQ